MKKPFLLFALKCAVILYFAACTSIEHYTVADALTPVITKGNWKVNNFSEKDQQQPKGLAAYTFTFTPSGDIAIIKNGTSIIGHWAEDEFDKSVNISLSTNDPELSKLNNSWKVVSATNGQVELAGSHSAKLNFVTL